MAVHGEHTPMGGKEEKGDKGRTEERRQGAAGGQRGSQKPEDTQESVWKMSYTKKTRVFNTYQD